MVLGLFQLMVAGVCGAGGASVQSLVVKVLALGGVNVSVPDQSMAAVTVLEVHLT